jgi:hypothetical protein
VFRGNSDVVVTEVVEDLCLFEVQAAIVDVLGMRIGHYVVPEMQILNVPSFHVMTNEELVLIS